MVDSKQRFRYFIDWIKHSCYIRVLVVMDKALLATMKHYFWYAVCLKEGTRSACWVYKFIKLITGFTYKLTIILWTKVEEAVVLLQSTMEFCVWNCSITFGSMWSAEFMNLLGWLWMQEPRMTEEEMDWPTSPWGLRNLPFLNMMMMMMIIIIIMNAACEKARI
jgi:hypothetical protein